MGISKIISALRFPLMLFVAASLISGIFTGWFRLGFDLPVDSVFLHHGAIMTGSFLGTVILVERIVALKKRWLFVFPGINVSSILFFYLDLPQWSTICLVIGSLGLIFVFYLINQIQSDLPHMLMWLASVCWFLGNGFLLFYSTYDQSLLWWMAFLLITITGERLELSRFLPVNHRKKQVLVAFLMVFLVSCMIPYNLGSYVLSGMALLGSAIWLMLYDMIRKSIKMPGNHRYTAVTLLMGYVWLGMSGIFFMVENSGVVSYDALIHTFFLGFVFSMIFAHAPIILPGVLGLSIKPYHPILYIWVVLLQITLLLRVLGGILEINSLLRMSALSNGLTIVLFLLSMLFLVIQKVRRLS